MLNVTPRKANTDKQGEVPVGLNPSKGDAEKEKEKASCALSRLDVTWRLRKTMRVSILPFNLTLPTNAAGTQIFQLLRSTP